MVPGNSVWDQMGLAVLSEICYLGARAHEMQVLLCDPTTK